MVKSIESLKFIFPWRSYQAQLLDNFRLHLEDHHFHVIAPPGSGKTILGLEILRRLGDKTLVLAPTITIRNQWKDRLQTFFSADKVFENFSFDIKAPSDITFATYQSLHAFYKTFEDKNDYHEFFKKHNIKTLVLDEAHHLKNAWWTCLMDLKQSQPFYMVSLTATPPYDSSRTELSKYFALSGKVDDEIAVPDLVKEQDLCPHQDYVYFSKPDDLEIHKIAAFREQIAKFKDALLIDEAFINLLENHRFFKNPHLHLDELYANTAYFSSILITLNHVGIYIETEKLELLGFDKKAKIKFPNLELDWLEILLQQLVIDDREQLTTQETYLKHLEKELRLINVLDRKKVDLIGADFIYKSLSNSPNKLKSIVEIVQEEASELHENLRCVVLTDYIRKEFISIESSETSKIDKIGVIPIFKHLSLNQELKPNLSVLTGSLVIIHQSCLEALYAIENKANLSVTPLESDNGFRLITANTNAKRTIVNSITTLFEKGLIKTLVGTKALLGEGWDAPSINCLVLASVVGSFVTSNQMRGRAIRVDANSPNKTGNIWHLASIDPTIDSGGKEIELLKRRFNAFVGISNSERDTISNGFERLNLPEHLESNKIEDINAETLNSAKNRTHISTKWSQSITTGKQLTKQLSLVYLKDKPFKKLKAFYALDTVKYLSLELLFGILFFYVEFFLNSINILFTQGVLKFIYALISALFIGFGYKFYKTLKLYLRHGFLYRKIKKMGYAVLDSLIDLDLITSNKAFIKVHSQVLDNGEITCNISGVNSLENTLFITALSEVIEPIDSPRYLLLKTNRFRKQFDVEHFIAVPDIFGDKKKSALIFQRNWNHYLGQTKLIYTRQFDGRKLLLKARLLHSYNSLKQTTKETFTWL